MIFYRSRSPTPEGIAMDGLLDILDEREWTVERLAVASGVNESEIRGLIGGSRSVRPSPGTPARLARALRCCESMLYASPTAERPNLSELKLCAPCNAVVAIDHVHC